MWAVQSNHDFTGYHDKVGDWKIVYTNSVDARQLLRQLHDYANDERGPKSGTANELGHRYFGLRLLSLFLGPHLFDILLDRITRSQLLQRPARFFFPLFGYQQVPVKP